MFGWKKKSKKKKVLKKKARKKVRYGRYVFLLIILGVCFYIFQPLERLTTVTYFQITDISVGGIENLSAKNILKRLNVKVGDNIFLLNRRESVNRLMQVPWVGDVSIRTVLPGKVNVSIKERIPIGFLGKGEKRLFDEKGMVFNNIKKNKYPIPHIVNALTNKKHLQVNELERYLDFLKAARLTGFDMTVSNENNWFVNIDKKGLTMNSDGGVFVLGKSDYTVSLKHFMLVQEKVFENLNSEKKYKVDLRFDKRVVVNQGYS